MPRKLPWMSNPHPWTQSQPLTNPKTEPATTQPRHSSSWMSSGPRIPWGSSSGFILWRVGCFCWGWGGLECSTEVRGPSQEDHWMILKLKSQTCGGINICSQANLPMIIQNFTFSGRDSFTQSFWKFCCSVSPACEGRRTQSALAYFVSKQLSDSISTNKKGYNYTVIL